MKTFNRTLPVKLTQAELLDRGEALALGRGNRNEWESDRKETAARYRERLDLLDAEIDRLAGIVREKAEPRPVECRSVRDADRGVVEVVRTDTGEIVESRVMSEQERQVRMFEPEDGPLTADEAVIDVDLPKSAGA